MSIVPVILPNPQELWRQRDEESRRGFNTLLMEMANKWTQPEPLPTFQPPPPTTDGLSGQMMDDWRNQSLNPQSYLNISPQGVQDYVVAGGTIPDLRKQRLAEAYSQYTPKPQFSSTPKFYGYNPNAPPKPTFKPTGNLTADTVLKANDVANRQAYRKQLGRSLGNILSNIQRRRDERMAQVGNMPVNQVTPRVIPETFPQRQPMFQPPSSEDMLQIEKLRSEVAANWALAGQRSRVDTPEMKYDIKLDEQGNYIYLPQTPGQAVPTGIPSFREPEKPSVHYVTDENGNVKIITPANSGEPIVTDTGVKTYQPEKARQQQTEQDETSFAASIQDAQKRLQSNPEQWPEINRALIAAYGDRVTQINAFMDEYKQSLPPQLKSEMNNIVNSAQNGVIDINKAKMLAAKWPEYASIINRAFGLTGSTSINLVIPPG